MSEQAVSTPRLRAVPGLRRNIVLSLAIAVLIIVLGGQGLLRSGVYAHLHIQPHAPRLSLLFEAPLAIKIHLAGALVALAVGVVLLAGVKGTGLHKTLGWTWVVAMGATAISSFWIHRINPGGLSFIHLLSGWTVIALPAAVYAIRKRKVAVHARAMTSMFVGGLVLAGVLSFLPGRLMWDLFF